MTRSLTWWEHEELLEHVRSRDDIWAEDGSLLVRYSGPASDSLEGEARAIAFAIQLVPAESTHRFRRTLYETTPIDWAAAEVDEYLLGLLTNHTSFGPRLESKRLLMDELHIPEDTADAFSVILAHSWTVGPVLDRVAAAKGEGWNDQYFAGPESKYLGTLMFRDAGSVRVYSNGTHLFRVLVSLAQRIDGGWITAELSGNLRPLGITPTHLAETFFDYRKEDEECLSKSTD